MSTSYTPISLMRGQTYTVNASYQRIAGANGTETVVIPPGFWNTVIDATVERVTLGVSLFDTRAYAQNGQLVIAVMGQGTELTISPAASGTQISYANGSVATVTRATSGALSMHYDTVTLPTNTSVSLPNGDVVVHGATGTESLNIAGNLRHVVVDAAVEQINLGMAYSASLLVPSAGQLLINDTAGVAVAQLSVASGHTEALSFSNARGTLGVGSGGMASFTLTDLLLDANQAYTAVQSNLRLYGNRGTESVTLSAAATNETLDERVEKVVFPSAYGSYTLKAGVSDVQVFNASNTLVADVFVSHAAAGTQLQFANGTYTASYTNGVLGLALPGGVAAPAAATPTTSGLQYTVGWGSFSSGQLGIQACLNKALADLGKYFNAKGVLDLSVQPETVVRSVLAEAKPAMIRTSTSAESTEFQLESISGTDSNGSSYDAVIYVNLANLASLNLDPTKAPTASQYDLTSILEHELLHAMGFTGEIGISTSVASPYDSLVRYTNGAPYFVGVHAQAAYGGPVPLAPASTGSGSAYYHVNVAGDLMSEGIGLGQVRTISKLDLAILQDMGDPVLVGISPSV
jgi:hypothetical protein